MTQEARELVRKLQEEAERLSGHSLDRGSVDAGIASNVADQAATTITALLDKERANEALMNERTSLIATKREQIEALTKRAEAAEQGKRVCVARVETLTTCGLAEVALGNPAVMRQWGELTARAEAAERERDEAITGSNALLASQNEIVHKITARAESAEARADKLAATLEPFGKLGDIILAEAPSEAQTVVCFTSASGEKFAMRLDYFRRARSALADKGVANG